MIGGEDHRSQIKYNQHLNYYQGHISCRKLTNNSYKFCKLKSPTSIHNRRRCSEKLSRYHSPNHYYSDDNILFLQSIHVEGHEVFLLYIPHLAPKMYNLYHLYSIPTRESTSIISPTAYVENTSYYLKYKCQDVQQFFCKLSDIDGN